MFLFNKNNPKKIEPVLIVFVLIGLVLTVGILVFLFSKKAPTPAVDDNKQVLSEKIVDDSVLNNRYLQTVDDFNNRISGVGYDVGNLKKDAEEFFLQTSVPAGYLDRHLSAFVEFNQAKDSGSDDATLLSSLIRIMENLKAVK